MQYIYKAACQPRRKLMKGPIFAPELMPVSIQFDYHLKATDFMFSLFFYASAKWSELYFSHFCGDS